MTDLIFPTGPGGQGYDPDHWKQSLEFQLDADARMAVAVLSLEHRTLTMFTPPAPLQIPIPFHVLKEAVAQILAVEVELAIAKLPAGARQYPERWPKGARGVKHVAELLMESAMLEAAGEAVTDGKDPHFQPNLKAILGGGEAP